MQCSFVICLNRVSKLSKRSEIQHKRPGWLVSFTTSVLWFGPPPPVMWAGERPFGNAGLAKINVEVLVVVVVLAVIQLYVIYINILVSYFINVPFFWYARCFIIHILTLLLCSLVLTYL